MVDAGGRRRRKAKQQNPTTALETGKTSNGDYYDDSDEEKEHGKAAHDDRLFGNACSMGQFFLNPCLCIYLGCRLCYSKFVLRQDEKHRSLPLSAAQWKRQQPLHALDGMRVLIPGGAAALACWYLLLPLVWHTTRHLGRPTTDYQVNQVPLRIPNLDFQSHPSLDIGGWLLYRHFHLPKQPIEAIHPDRGDLAFIGEFGKRRETRPDELEAALAHFEATHVDYKHVQEWNMFDEEIEDEVQECRRLNWPNTYRPSCNGVHEILLSVDYKETQTGVNDQMYDTFFISHGYYRDVWVIDRPDQDLKSILKMTRWKHKVDIDTLNLVLKDAMIMERLTASPRIVDVWGHCGTTVWVEALPYEVQEVIVPGSGMIKQKDLHDENEVQPQNEYSDAEKLELALAMAESIADLHGFRDGVIVHDDIQLCQWLRSREGVLKLGDFNRGEVMEYNPDKEEYCKYNNGNAYGNYRAPEEFDVKDLDEQIDIFSFGNNIYALLTGLWVFYETDDDEVVHERLIKGETPFIDGRYRERSFVDGKLVEIMERCWVYDPAKRIDIFEVVRLLRDVKTEFDRRELQGVKHNK